MIIFRCRFISMETKTYFFPVWTLYEARGEADRTNTNTAYGKQPHPKGIHSLTWVKHPKPNLGLRSQNTCLIGCIVTSGPSSPSSQPKIPMTVNILVQPLSFMEDKPHAPATMWIHPLDAVFHLSPSAQLDPTTLYRPCLFLPFLCHAASLSEL